MLMGDRPRPARGWLLALFMLVAPLAGGAASWNFRALSNEVPDSDFKTAYEQRLFSVATAVGADDHLYGSYVTPEGQVASYNILFSDNPAFTVVHSQDFVSLSAGVGTCTWFICIQDYPFGISITDTGAHTAWLDAAGTDVLRDSLPFARYPGNFVEENADGVVATTQQTIDGTFGAVLEQSSQMTIEFTDINWLVAVNEGAEPLVLGYQGLDGACLIYGEGCEPVDCDDGPNHQNTRGVGHREHGRGYGYGHERHECEHNLDGSTSAGAPVLIQVRTNNTWQSWQFPEQVSMPGGSAAATALFPLAMNADTVILRGNTQYQGEHYPKRLFRCDLPTTPDANGDGIVDCVDGLKPLLPLADSPEIGTVLGFTLNDSGILVGNYGFNAAGTGTPLVIDTTAGTPVVLPLRHLTSGTAGWELNTITDLNDAGTATGYGHQDCSAQPESFTLHSADFTPPPVIIDHAVQTNNGALAPGDSLEPVIPAEGGSGLYEYRLSSKRPADSGWALIHDWQAAPATIQAPPDYLGDICVRVEVRDQQAASDTAETILRLRVTDQPLNPDSDARNIDFGIEPGDSGSSDPLEAFQVGSFPAGSLIALLIAGMLRRRPMV